MLPPLVDGGYHIIAELDSKQQVADSNRANNTVASGALIQVSVPTLTLGTSISGTITNGQDLYYRVLTTPGESVALAANVRRVDRGRVRSQLQPTAYAFVV